MKVVILHHHLRNGGVGRVIRSQVKALLLKSDIESIKIVTGDCPEGLDFGCEVVVCHDLDYLDFDRTDYHNLYDQYEHICNTLTQLVDKDTVLHVHNLNLGKNPLVTYAVYYLAWQCRSVLNHCHDFAEDRPQNWAFIKRVMGNVFKSHHSDILYPNLKNYRFAVINSYDYKRLSKSKIHEERISVVPNPIEGKSIDDGDLCPAREELCEQLGLDPEKMIMTYPVRVIQRKNIGEFILLAMLFADKAEWLVTQAPQNPKEKHNYNEWRKFAEKHSIPVRWDVGSVCDFPTIMKGTDKCVTTSIREGFGMVYLEPWLFDKETVGRDIPFITNDFKSNGVEFSYLYSSLKIQRGHLSYDFKEFTRDEQMKAIEQILSCDDAKAHFLSVNSTLDQLLEPPCDQLVQKNKLLIEEQYSLEQYGEQLYGIYETMS